MHPATSDTRQEVLGDITKVQGELWWYGGGRKLLLKGVSEKLSLRRQHLTWPWKDKKRRGWEEVLLE